MVETKIHGVPLKAAFGVSSISSHKYSADLLRDYCYGSPVHGGYLASVILHVLSQHFEKTLKDLHQPDTIALHLEFLRPASAGSADLDVKDAKLGAETSTVHVSLSQGGKERVAGYATHLEARKRAQDRRWVAYSNPYHPESFSKVQTQIRYVLPASGQPHSSIMDEWITPTSPEDKFTTMTLGFVADQWAHPAENYRPGSPHSSDGIVSRANKASTDASTVTDNTGWRSPFWYPTLQMNLEIKKPLPPEGVDWLFVRVRAKEIKNGRMDLEITIMDENLELVALSHHVAFIVSIARGTSGSGARSKV